MTAVSTGFGATFIRLFRFPSSGLLGRFGARAGCFIRVQLRERGRKEQTSQLGGAEVALEGGQYHEPEDRAANADCSSPDVGNVTVVEYGDEGLGQATGLV